MTEVVDYSLNQKLFFLNMLKFPKAQHKNSSGGGLQLETKIIFSKFVNV